jgi:hypothetical protein
MAHMHDLKYTDELLLRISPAHLHQITFEAENTIFAEVATVFKEMMERVRLLAQLPEYMVRATAQQVMFDVASCYEAFNDPLATGPFTKSQLDQLMKVRERMIAEEIKDNENEEHLNKLMNKRITDSMHMLKSLCSVSEGHEFTLTGMEVLLISLMLQTWTAFEAFVTDTWVVALNLGPKSWARQVTAAKSEKDGKEQRKTIPLSQIEKFNFDLTKNMGSLLKEKFDFARLKNVKGAYLAAFGGDASPLFDTNNLNPANVAALEAIRNVFAHRGGRVDEEFRGLVSKCPASEYYWLRDLKDGDKVRIDGAMVRDLWVSTCINATALVIFLNQKMS